MTWPTSANVTPVEFSDSENPTPSTSPEAEELVASGAKPVEVDTQELMRQLQAQVAEQQKYIDKLAAERGVPLNPRDVFVQALGDHLHAQANANPLHAEDYKRVQGLVADVQNSPNDLTVDRAAFLRECIEDLRAIHPQHELAYVAELAKSLHNHLRYPENAE